MIVKLKLVSIDILYDLYLTIIVESNEKILREKNLKILKVSGILISYIVFHSLTCGVLVKIH